MSLEDLGKLQQRIFTQRLPVYMALAALLFGLIVLRLYYLQIVRGEHFRRLAEDNRLTLVRLRAPRGSILDRHGNVLAANRPSFSVGLETGATRGAGRDLEATLDFLAATLSVDRGELERRIAGAERRRRDEPVRVSEDVGRREVAVLETMRYEHPGIVVEVEPRRSYPFGALAAHLIGYVGQISPEELRARGGLGYRMGDTVGKMGIEKAFDAELRGRDGFEQTEVDSLGRGGAVLARIAPTPGHDVTLTLDLGLQQAVEAALADRPGAVIVLDPRDGAVLASVSSPAIDPNRFSDGLSPVEWSTLNADRLHPLQNRSLQGQYPPGSVFKIVTAAAGLETGSVRPSTTFTCRGGMRFGNREFRCWKRGGHGEVDLRRALVESCDVYFYQLGLKVGIDAIAAAARDLGLGETTGIEIGGEAPGLVPDTGWKLRARGEPWYPGETLSAAIGQGFDLATPLQLASLVSTVGNGGRVVRPHLLGHVSDAEGAVVRRHRPGPGRRLGFSAGTLEIVRDALRGVVADPGGTGGAARVPGLEVAGKTGTSQVARMPARGERRTGEVPRELRDHAWFVAYAPAGTPQIAMAAIVEHAGHGGTASAPIARRVIEEFRNLGYLRVPGRGEGGEGP